MKYIILLLFSNSLYSETLSFDLIKKEVLKNYPKILNQIQKVEKQKAQTQLSDGGFDSNLTFKGKKYIDSYYESELFDIGINKKLKQLNSDVSLGFRKGTGLTPVYYNEWETNAEGEFYIKFQMSLLRYRSIDEGRFRLWEARNKLEIERLSLQLNQLDILVLANAAYWKWKMYFDSVEIYEKLISLNQKRYNAIKKRISRNDLPRIYEVEAKQYLLSFRSQLALAIAAKKQAFEKLKVFYPQITNSSTPLETINLKISKFEVIDSESILEKSPEIQIFKILIENMNLEKDLSKQSLLPKLDLSIAHYQANEEKKPFLDENVISLNLEIPLERDLGKGKVSKNKAQISILENELLLMKRKRRSYLNSLIAKIEGDAQSVLFLKQEVKAAARLQKAEWTKFKAGASDIFIVNNRDVNLAKAQLSLIKKHSDYNIDYYSFEQWKNLSLK